MSQLRADGAYGEYPARVRVDVSQACSYHFVVWCVRLHIRFPTNVSPCEASGAPKYLPFLFGFQPLCKSVRVREGAFSVAGVCKVADALFCVSTAFVAPYPRLLCITRHPYAVPSDLLGWYLIVVVSRFPFLPVVRVDGVKWCVSGVRQPTIDPCQCG